MLASRYAVVNVPGFGTGGGLTKNVATVSVPCVRVNLTTPESRAHSTSSEQATRDSVMSIFVRHLETAVPATAYAQEYIEARMLGWAATERQRRILRQVYRNSGIDRRHSVVSDFMSPAPQELYQVGADGAVDNPGTAARNAFFVKHARVMAVDLTRRALANCPGLEAGDVTHVITVSCTGFSNPGLDYAIVRELGLAPSVQRYQLGFMGCYAAIPALRMAHQFCAADPAAVVLVVCLEFCTVHLHPRGGLDDMLANAIFADGAACAIVSARPPPAGSVVLSLEGFASTLIPEGEKDMAWTVSDHGFDITLSSYVPKLIADAIHDFVDPLLAAQRLQGSDIAYWAVHPGGRAIVDKVAEGLGLRPAQVAASREVLRRYGNMSSPTVLFVLQELWRTAARPGDRILAMAFGPGLTVESGLLRLQMGQTNRPSGKASYKTGRDL